MADMMGGGFDGLTVSAAAIAAIGVAFAAVVKAFRAGEEKGKQQRTKIEPTPLPVCLVETLATKEEMRELEGRLISEIKKLETALVGERGVARTANGNLHARIDKIAEGLAATTATMTQLNAGLNRVLDLLMNHSPKPSNRRTP
jgi:hypothetical protein